MSAAEEAVRPAPAAVVTGASAGIGFATAAELADSGWSIAVVDRDLEAAELAASRLAGSGAAAVAIAADVTRTRDVERMATVARERFGRVDALVNNAGLPASHEAASITDEEWAAALEVNLSGALRCCRALYAELAEAAGAIVNVASLAALLGMPGRVAYSAAKSALVGVTRTLAIEWAPVGIRVNAVAPGYVRTAGFEDRLGPELIRELESEVPLGGLCTPAEVAATIAFLVSGKARMLTGQTVVLDGGLAVRGRG